MFHELHCVNIIYIYRRTVRIIIIIIIIIIYLFIYFAFVNQASQHEFAESTFLTQRIILQCVTIITVDFHFSKRNDNY